VDILFSINVKQVNGNVRCFSATENNNSHPTRKSTIYLASYNRHTAHMKNVIITNLHESRVLIISNVTCSITITCALQAQRKSRKALAVGAFVNAEIAKYPENLFYR
jgi:hypothetical protein